MPLQYSATGSIDRSRVELLDKRIDLAFMRMDRLAGNVLGQFFDVTPIDSGLTYRMQSFGSALPVPVRNEDTDALPYFTPAPGYPKDFVLVRCRAGIRVTRTIMLADRHNKVEQMTTGQVKSAGRKDEYERAAIFNSAFSGTDGADSLSLCNNSHPHEDPTAGTWDNLGTGALTPANLQALRLLARKMTNEIGAPDPAMPVTLLCGPDIEQKALEYTKADLKPETDFNNPNVLVTNLRVVTTPWITSTTAYWVICDKTGNERGLHEVVLEKWNIANNSPANADILIDKRIASNKAFGFYTSKNVYGSAGT